MATEDPDNTESTRTQRSSDSGGEQDRESRPAAKRPATPKKTTQTRSAQDSSGKSPVRRKRPPESAEKSSGGGQKPTRSPSDAPSKSAPRISTAKAARSAMDQLRDLTDRDPEGIVGIQREDDGWTVTIEVVETRRVPNTSDVLAEYEVTIDADAELVSYSRGARYVRGQARDG